MGYDCHSFSMVREYLSEMSSSLRRKDFKWGLSNCRWPLLTIYTAGYILYIVFGGAMFMAIEGYEEPDLQKKLGFARERIIDKFPNVTGAVLDDFISEMSSMGISGLQGLNATEAKWTLSQAIFFCVTVLTTIGYGHVSPSSQLGKGLCMLYSALGIPFTLIILAAYVQRLMTLAYKIQKALASRYGYMLKPIKIRFVFLAMVMVIVLTLFFMLPALLFSYLEDGWTYLDGLYFCFISLTTVGLGDLVPSKTIGLQYRAVYRLGVTVYLMLGVLALMFLMALVAQFHECILCQINSAKNAEDSSSSNDNSSTNDMKYPSYGSFLTESDLLLHSSMNPSTRKEKQPAPISHANTNV